MKVCEYCGQKLSNDAVECSSCGAKEFENKCDNCGEDFKGDLCPKCGVKIGQEAKTCPKCGKISYQRFCVECGTDLERNMRKRSGSQHGASVNNISENRTGGRGAAANSGYSKRKNRICVILGVGIPVIMFIWLCVQFGYQTAADGTATITEGMDSGDSDRWNGCLEVTGGVWQQDQNGWWYTGQDGSYVKDDIGQIDGKFYCFDEFGYMLTGWHELEDGSQIYLQEDGSMAQDQWVTAEDGKIYYLKGDGIMAKNVTIRSESKGMIFKFDGEGVCDPEGIKIE